MKKTWKWVRIFLIILFIIYKLITIVPETHKKVEDSPVNSNPQLEVKEYDVGYVINWQWYDYDLRPYAIKFNIPYAEIEQAIHSRLYDINMSSVYPDEIDYTTLISSGGILFMDDIIQQLEAIAVENKLSYNQLANVTVSMIQYIPYTLLHQLSHDQINQIAREQHMDFILSYHNDPANNPYNRQWYGGCRDSADPAGVYAPAEFISTMKGDCDTRTLFLYTLMKKMGYNVAILNGPGHSMLGCTLPPENPASPYINSSNGKYYFWETTVFYNQSGITGPRLGEILDEKFNVDEWKIVL